VVKEDLEDFAEDKKTTGENEKKGVVKKNKARAALLVVVSKKLRQERGRRGKGKRGGVFVKYKKNRRQMRYLFQKTCAKGGCKNNTKKKQRLTSRRFTKIKKRQGGQQNPLGGVEGLGT